MEKKLAEAQAELQAQVLRDLTKEKLATKEDLRTLRQEMTLRIGGITCTGLIVLVALMKLLHL